MPTPEVKEQVEKMLKGLKEAGASQQVQEAARKWLDALPEPKKK